MDIFCDISGIWAWESPNYSVDIYRGVRGRKILYEFNSISLLILYI